MKLVDTIDSVLRLKGHHVWSVAPTATVFDLLLKVPCGGLAPAADCWVIGSKLRCISKNK